MTRTVDPFDDALADLRISGSVLLHEAYSPPWAIEVPNEARLQKTLNVGPDVRVLPFHLVRRRGFSLEIQGARAVEVEAPEVCICPGGHAHRLSVGRSGQVTALDAILSGNGPRPAHARDPAATELVCGVFMARSTPLSPMLGALPSVVKVSTGDEARYPALAGAVALLLAELGRGGGGGFTISRLLEIFCAEAFRAEQTATAEGRPSWFRGLADPKISEAIRMIHADPGRGWTVDALAKRVALSPSRFAARFRETTGESVMRYVAVWRANVACRFLRESEMSLSEVAHRVGYESLPAFSRAFKEQLGMPPAAWRASSNRAGDGSSGPAINEHGQRPLGVPGNRPVRVTRRLAGSR
jgi:AraC-like DNA-binding protein